jgi:Tfp pilus assembly protein PilV
MASSPRSARTRNKILHGQAGFLLVEILLVVVILAVGLTVVLRSFGSSLDAVGTSASYTKALLLLEERLWELEAKGSIAPGTSGGGFSEENGNFRWEVKASDLAQMGLCETQVTVAWEQRGRPRAVSITTYLKRE